MKPAVDTFTRLRRLATLLAALAGIGMAQAAAGDAWHLQKIVVANHLDPQVELFSLYADEQGGDIGIDIDGSVGNTCPGGQDHVGFGWSLPDPAVLIEGATFDIDLRISGFGYDPCKGHMSLQSYLGVQDANTSPDALANKSMKAVDRTRFHAAAPATLLGTGPDGQQAEYAQGMTLTAGPPAAGRPYAYFAVRMTAFGSARGIDIVYVFSKEPAPLEPPTVGAALPPPG